MTTANLAANDAALEHGSGGTSNPILGMLLFITSEVMFFAGLFAAYFNVRANAPTWPPVEFVDKVHVFPLVGPATFLLITSSFTIHAAVRAIRRGDRRGMNRALAVSLALGVTFLVMQVADYVMLYNEDVRLDAGTFGTTYYTLTGFHGAHVLAGVIMIAVALYRGTAGQFSARHHDAVEATSLYWHFVDIVWIALFSILYLLPGH